MSLKDRFPDKFGKKDAHRGEGQERSTANPGRGFAGERHEQVTALCGHTVLVPLYAPKLPKQAQQIDEHNRLRVEKAKERKCAACNMAEQERLRLEAKGRKKGGRGGQPRVRAPRLCPVCKNAGATHRLPSGASFEVLYDEGSDRWCGMLKVPGGKTYSDSDPGVHRLLQKLDRKWQADAYPEGQRPFEVEKRMAEESRAKQEGASDTA